MKYKAKDTTLSRLARAAKRKADYKYNKELKPEAMPQGVMGGGGQMSGSGVKKDK